MPSRTTACRARRRQQGRLLASSWRPRGRCPVAPARSEAEAAANAHLVVGDVSPDVVEIPTGLTPRAQVLQPRRLITASPVIPSGFPPLVVRSVQHTVGRSARQTVITARPASAGAGHRTAEYRRNNEPVLRRYSAVATSIGPPQETNPAPPRTPPLTHWRPGRSSGQRSAGLWPSLSRAPDGEGGPRTPFDQADPARSTVLVRTPSGAGRNQATSPEHVRVSSPVSPAVPRARLRGGASHEAQGRRGARGGGAGRSGATRGRLGVLRQILHELVAGLEQFLLVDDVVAVEDGAGLVAGQKHGDPLGDTGADQVAGGGAAAVVEEAGRHAGRLTGGAPRRAPAADGDAVAVEDQRAVGVAARPPSRLPDLEERILGPLLAAPMSTSAGMSDEIAIVFAAPAPPRMCHLALLFATVTQPRFHRDPAGTGG